MKFAKLLHNPQAGEGELTKKELVSMIKTGGYQCRYSSTKGKWWENLESNKYDFLVVAGGDGTIRKVAARLLDRKLMDKKFPVGLLPLGTANNVAKTLGINREHKKTIKGWENAYQKKFDVGLIFDLKKYKFFLESFGLGLFPKLMKEMEEIDKKIGNDPEKRVKKALQLLYDITPDQSPCFCRITADGKEYSGHFLLVEVMNTRSIGPNLHLAPLADPGDGWLDIVLISETQREEFRAYVKEKLNGNDTPSLFNVLRAKNLQIYWEGTQAHVDDVMVTLKKPIDIKIELQEGVLHFLTPSQNSVNNTL